MLPYRRQVAALARPAPDRSASPVSATLSFPTSGAPVTAPPRARKRKTSARNTVIPGRPAQVYSNAGLTLNFAKQSRDYNAGESHLISLSSHVLSLRRLLRKSFAPRLFPPSPAPQGHGDGDDDDIFLGLFFTRLSEIISSRRANYGLGPRYSS